MTEMQHDEHDDSASTIKLYDNVILNTKKLFGTA